MDAAGTAPHGGGCGLELETLACLSGLEFCQAFVDQLAVLFGADLVTVGELKIAETERIRVLASYFDGMQLGDFEYESCVTPCHDVVQNGDPLMFPCRVQEMYPDDEMFIEEGIQSYIGVALKNSDGDAIGLVQAAWRREIDDGFGRRAVAAMEQFAPRLGAEIAGLQTLATLAVLTVTAHVHLSLKTLGLSAYGLICVGAILTGTGAHPLIYAAGFLLIAGFDKMFNIYVRTLRKEIIPAEDFGKTTGVIICLNNLSQPFAGLVVALFAAGDDARAVLLGLSAAMAVLGFVTFGRR